MASEDDTKPEGVPILGGAGDTFNLQGVSSQGTNVVVLSWLMPGGGHKKLTRTEALNLAAWLVVVTLDKDGFERLYAEIIDT